MYLDDVIMHRPNANRMRGTVIVTLVCEEIHLEAMSLLVKLGALRQRPKQISDHGNFRKFLL